MKTRVRQLPITGWVAEVRQGCCNWLPLRKDDAAPYIPQMQYENYHVCATKEQAEEVQRRYEESHP